MYLATSKRAVASALPRPPSCGKPPPTTTASAPASMTRFASRHESTGPAMTSTFGYSAFNAPISFNWPSFQASLGSTQMTSAPASASARARARGPPGGCSPSSFHPAAMTLAPASSCPWKSRDIRGKSRTFLMSERVTMVMSRPSLFTIGSFPTLDFLSWPMASSIVRGSRPLTTRFTMTSEIRVPRSATVSVSRELRKPTSLELSLPFSVMQIPLMPFSALILSASFSVWSGRNVTGSRMKPLTKRFALLTISACASTLWLQWMKPMPPTRARLMASSASVTVSAGLPTRGKLSRILGVSWLLTSTSDASKEVCPGMSTMSSNV
mmetsp:Transcript_74541/g.230366  ORF Transcript_74541/g.230366 Transcript_74541/m.230366 type:complete len:325 (+) Transcript_74541:654-1628(+)